MQVDEMITLYASIQEESSSNLLELPALLTDVFMVLLNFS
jgi:hypothetical protein